MPPPLLNALCLAALAVMTGTAIAGKEKPKPNVILILVDDLGWSDTSPYGSTYYETPSLERLARDGMRFTDAYAASPLCSPTRASIMTGQYPARLHLTEAITPNRATAEPKALLPKENKYCGDVGTKDHLPLEVRTLAEALKQDGYNTAHIGKWHLSTPRNVGTPLLLPVLTRFGRTDLAYKILLQEDYPSWLYTVRNGATTMWERWNSYTKEEGFGPVGMNSFNHYAYGAVGEWMYGVIGGIRPLAPGFKKILFAPEPGNGITSAETSLPTPHGLAECCWRVRGRTMIVDVTVPEGVRAELRLPGRKAAPLASGRHRLTTKLNRP